MLTNMAFVVVDLDGCLIDDVHGAFGKFLRREDSLTEHLFKELIFNALDRIPSAVDSVAKNTDISKGLNMNVIKALKAIYDSRVDIIVRTANKRLGYDGAEKVKKALKENGIEASVELTTDKMKYAERNGEKPSLILDDKPDVALNAARNGIKAILISSDYNRAAGFFMKSINTLLKVVKPEDMERECIKSLALRSKA
jgi:uncharacterized HAD superfamily protein